MTVLGLGGAAEDLGVWKTWVPLPGGWTAWLLIVLGVIVARTGLDYWMNLFRRLRARLTQSSFRIEAPVFCSQFMPYTKELDERPARIGLTFMVVNLTSRPITFDNRVRGYFVINRTVSIHGLSLKAPQELAPLGHATITLCAQIDERLAAEMRSARDSEPKKQRSEFTEMASISLQHVEVNVKSKEGKGVLTLPPEFRIRDGWWAQLVISGDIRAVLGGASTDTR